MRVYRRDGCKPVDFDTLELSPELWRKLLVRIERKLKPAMVCISTPLSKDWTRDSFMKEVK